MTPQQVDRKSALCELLEMPDEPGMKRGHRLTVEGRADRYQQLPTLYAAFIAWQRVRNEERVQ